MEASSASTSVKRVPLSPDELLREFKSKSPEHSQKFDQMYQLFKHYKRGEMGGHQVLSLIKQADDALTAVSNKKVKLRDIQLMNIILLTAFPESGTTLGQISTGEGKSNIIKVMSYVKAKQNPHRQVDVITTAENLAIRDAQDKETVAFFKKLGLTVDHNIDLGTRKVKMLREFKEGRNKGPLAANILYGTTSTFAFMHLESRTERYIPEFYHQRLSLIDTCPLIVDEVDSLLIDSKGNSALLSTGGKSNSNLLTIKGTIFQTIVALQYQQDPNLVDVSEFEACSQEFSIQEHAKMAAQAKAAQMSLNNDEQATFESSCERWVEACYGALFDAQEGVDYIIQNGKIHIVDSKNTGETQTDSRWTGGRHTFLEMKHNLKLGDDTPVCHSMSYFSLYKKYGNRIRGLTGTLGSSPTKEFLKDMYGAEMYISPRYIQTGLVIETAIPTSMPPAAEIVEKCRLTLKQQRPVLLINKDIKTCQQYKQLMEESLKPEFPKLKVVEFWDSEKTSLTEELKEVDGNTIVVASNLAGRGTDIIISDSIDKRGGLQVIQTSLAQSQRVDEQAQGRAGRCGQNGSCITIYEASPKLVQLLNVIQTQCPGPRSILHEHVEELVHTSELKLRDQLEQAMIKAGKIQVGYQLILDQSYQKLVSLLDTYPHVKRNGCSAEILSQRYSSQRLLLENEYSKEQSDICGIPRDDAEKDRLLGELRADISKKFEAFFNKIEAQMKSADSAGMLTDCATPEMFKPSRVGNGQDAENLRRAEEALKDDPNNKSKLFMKAVALFNMKEIPKAKELVAEIMQIEVANTTAQRIQNSSNVSYSNGCNLIQASKSYDEYQEIAHQLEADLEIEKQRKLEEKLNSQSLILLTNQAENTPHPNIAISVDQPTKQQDSNVETSSISKESSRSENLKKQISVLCSNTISNVSQMVENSKPQLTELEVVQVYL